MKSPQLTARLDRDGALGRITLSAPPGNTLAHPVFADALALRSFLDDPGLAGVVVAGEGRHFCGGADREALASQLSDPVALREALVAGKSLLDLLAFATVPVVAAIRGQCLGAGLEIALACHFRVASSSAMLGFPEATLGLMPGFGGTVADGARIGRRALADLVLTGRMIGAIEARDMGLVDEVVETVQVEAAARRRIDTLIADRPPALIRAVMESVHNGRRLPRGEALARETELFFEVARAARAGEGER